MKINFPKNKILIGLVTLAIIVVGLILIFSKGGKSSLAGAIFYFKSEGKDASLFYVNDSM